MTTQSVSQLLQQGLLLALVGLVLVFAALLLLWGLIALLMRLTGRRADGRAVGGAGAAPLSDEGDPALTAERARVAAVVAAALMANALPILFDVPSGPAFEHGRTAPLWVTANRAYALQSWQPPRRREEGREF